MSHSLSPPAAPRDDQTVYTTVSRNRTQRSGTEKIFHTDRGCPYLTETPGEVEDHAQSVLANGWRECKACADEESVGEAKQIPCPNCGRDCENLPNHLRGCDG